MLNEFRTIDFRWDKVNDTIRENIETVSSDERGRKLVVQVLNNGQVEDVTGVGLSLYWETKDRHHDGLDSFDLVDAKQGIFELYFTTEMLSNIGDLRANLHLIDSNAGSEGAITSKPFIIEVRRGINTEAVESEDSFSALTEALVRVVAIESQEEERQDNEKKRQKQEEARGRAEDTRQTQEEARERGEADRNTKYWEAEIARDSRYNFKEGKRDNLYSQAEAGRDNKYNTAETSRDSTFTQSQIERKDEYEKEKSARESENSFRNIFNGTTRYFAHRGFSGYYPENTLKAFDKASHHGFYGIELDVHYTSDNKWVVHHDATLNRMTNSTGNIKDKTFNTVTNTSVTKGAGQEFVADEKVPSFESVLQFARQENLVMQVEVKSTGIANLESLVDLVKKYNMLSRVVFMSFKVEHIERIRQLSELALLTYVSSSYSQTVLNTAISLGRCGLSIKYTAIQDVLSETLEEAHNNGVPIGCWTVNDLNHADTLAKTGFDFVTTDVIPGNRVVNGIRNYTLRKGPNESDFSLKGINPDNTDVGAQYTADDCYIERQKTTEVRVDHAVPFLTDLSGRTIRGNAQAGMGGSVADYDVMTSTENLSSFRFKFIDRKTGTLVNLDDLPNITMWVNIQVRGYDRGQ